MTEQEFYQAIDEVFLNTNGIDIPYIGRGFYQDGMMIDGYIRYEDLIKLGEVVKRYVEGK
jgi:hypothetical protein